MGKLVFLLFTISFFGNSQEIISEEMDIKNGEIQIPGTLTYPKTKNKLPLIIYVHGSGNIDRNGNLPATVSKANYIKTLADSLNTKKIAFYRYDKRTSSKSNLKLLKDNTLLDFVEDVKTVIQYFKTDTRFNSIHLVGHSQGSLVAMLSITKEIDSYISLAGPSESIDKILIWQLSRQNKDFRSVLEEHFKELGETDTIQKVNPYLANILHPQNQKFIAHWMKLDPVEEIKKLNLPILIINGDEDLQVTVKNAENLHKANPNSELQIIPRMNHILKEVNSIAENQKAYMDESIPLAKAVVTGIATFVKKATKH